MPSHFCGVKVNPGSRLSVVLDPGGLKDSMLASPNIILTSITKTLIKSKLNICNGELASLVRGGLNRLQGSQFARDAFLLLILNVFTRAVNFLGLAYAARCLGPVNLGVSALIQTTARQVALSFDGGFSVVGVRKIAGDKEKCAQITEAISAFQLAIALLATLVWGLAVSLVVPRTHRSAWFLGIPLVVFYATNFTYALQGLEKLPLQSAISAAAALLGTLAYFLLFHPGMPLGSDLLVMAFVGAVTWLTLWSAYYRLFGRLPIGRVHWKYIRTLLAESWRYWLLAAFVYLYSVFQIPLISFFLGYQEAGIFRSAFMLASGLELLFNSINNLLLARLVAWRKLGLQIMWRRQFRLLFLLLAIGLPPVIVLIVGAPLIYRLFLGPAFMAGIPVFQTLVVGRLVVFLGQVFAWGLAACDQDKPFLIVTMLGAALSVAMNIAVIPLFGIQGSALVSILVELMIAVGCYLCLRVFVLSETAATVLGPNR